MRYYANGLTKRLYIVDDCINEKRNELNSKRGKEDIKTKTDKVVGKASLSCRTYKNTNLNT